MIESDIEIRAPLVAEIKRLRRRVAQLEALEQEREQSGELLRRDDKTKRAFLEAIPDIFFRFRADGTFTHCHANDPGKLLISPDEFLGKTPEETLPPELAKLTMHYLNEAFRTGAMQIYEYSLPQQDTQRYYEARMVPLGDREAMAFVRDNTDRRRAEEALRESEASLARAQEIAHLGSWELDSITKELRWSDEVFRIFGMIPQQCEMTSESFIAAVHPDDRERLIHLYEDSIRNRNSYESVHRIVRPDGVERVVREQCEHLFHGEGEPVRSIGTVLDITDIQRAESTLRAQEEGNSALLQAIPDLFFRMSADGTFTDCHTNDQTKMLKPPGEFLGKRPEEVMPPDLAEGVMYHLNRAISTGEMQVYEYSLAFNGENHHYEARMVPIGNVEVVAIVRDTTERKQVEEALQRADEYLRALSDASFEAIFLSEKGICLGQNLTAEEMFGYGPEEVVGKPGTNWIAPEDRDHVIANMVAGYEGSYEATALRQDGTTFPAEIQARMIEYQGRSVRVTALRDISERKRTEAERERLMQAVEQSGETILITDSEGMIQYVNPAFEKTSGYSREEVIGKNPRILKSGKHDDVFYNQMWRALTSGKTWNGRIVNLGKSGDLFTEEAVISPVRDTTGKTTNYIAVKHDVTREAKLEAQLQQAQKMDSLGTLAGGIAHDFNNILSPIMGYSNMVLNILPEGGKAREYCEEIFTASQRATDLVEQILMFSRQAEHQDKLIELHVSVSEALKLLRASLPSTCAIESRIDTHCGTILGDTSQIHQIMMNLCTNASHALTDDGGVIEVTLEATILTRELDCVGTKLPAGDYITLSVGDNGTGIGDHTRSRMFDPFFTTKGVGEGTGLGLSTTHGIVSRHRGGITVESEIGVGSTFTVHFPRITQQTRQEETSSRIRASGHDTKVLIVDDEPSIGRMVAEMLGNLDYQVTVERSSVDALELFRDAPANFDLILTDLTMSEMTGEKMIEAILEIRPDIPVVFMTGYASACVGEITKGGRKWDCIKKPIDMSTLVSAVERAVSAAADQKGDR